MILVEVRCRFPKCRRLLAQFDRDRLLAISGGAIDWTATTVIPSCPRHSGRAPSTKNGRFRGLEGVERTPDGKFWTDVGWRIELGELKPSIEKALRSRHTQQEKV